MTMNPSVQTFPEILAKLHTAQYTGPVIVQFGQGVPSEVQIPREPERIRVDKGKRTRQT